MKKTLAMWMALFITVPILLVTFTNMAEGGSRINLKKYYPNPALAYNGEHLEGFNYEHTPPSRSVLWFEEFNKGRFRQYNSAPGERCHYDALRWRKVLKYSGTHDSCGAITYDTIYSPAIVFIPKRWNGDHWIRNGVSSVTQKENGVTVCTGTNTWRADLFGYVEVTPGVQGIHWRSTQSTVWDTGNCADTEWQEDYFMIDSLPGGKGLKRSVGGNKSGSFRWDVWFDRWDNN